MDKLLKQLAEIDGKLDALASDPNLTEAQIAEHDALQGERVKVITAIGRAKASASRSVERDQLAAEAVTAAAALKRESRTVVTPRLTETDAVTPNGATAIRVDEQGRTTGFFEPTDETVNLRFGESRGAQQRQSYRQQRQRNLRELKTAGYVPWGEFKNARDFIRSGLDGHQNNAFRDRVGKHYSAVLGMSEGIGFDGGYTVMPEFGASIIDRVWSNSLWAATDNYTVTGNTMTFLANAETSRATGSRAGGLRGYWLGEGSTVTPSKPTLREVSLKLAKLGVIVYLTQELIDDGGDALETYVQRKAAEEFEFLIGDALINGTGTGQPLGVLNAPSLISVAKETGQAAATLQTENIAKMFTRFFAPNLDGMVTYHHQDIGSQLYTMTLGIGAAGVTTYMPPGGMSGSPFATLMGKPMQATEFNATLGTQGDIVMADLDEVLSISKGGIASAVSMHVQFLTDQMALRFIMRLNARPWESAPITPFKGSNTQSSFVTLDTRA